MNKTHVNRIIMHGPDVQGSHLRHVHIDIIHAGYQVAKGSRQGRLQRQAGLRRRPVHEPGKKMRSAMFGTLNKS